MTIITSDNQSGIIEAPAGTVVRLYKSNPTLTGAVYVRGLNLIASRTDGAITYYHYNAHGDVVQTTTAYGAMIHDYSYDAFGVERNAAEGDTNPFRYCGEQFDAETGNYYLRARYYAPGVGSFTQEDPVMDGLNWYAYCSGNPVSFIDPAGLDAVLITAADAAFGQGHTSVLTQDTRNGNWYYFYWGMQSVYFVEVPWQDGAMSSLEAFNDWLDEKNLPYNTTGYTSATFVEGDFNASVDYFKDLVNSTVIDIYQTVEATKYDRPSEITYSQKNLSYDLFQANCLQMTMKGFGKGTLKDGLRVSRFMERQLEKTTWGLGVMRPNSAEKVFHQVFFNKSFTRQGAKNDITWEKMYGERDNQFRGKGLYYAATLGI